MDHLLLVGSPDSGMTRFAREEGRKFPFPSRESVTDRSYIYRVTGLEWPGDTVAPFRAPHHTASMAALRGTFRREFILRPGELSIAHGGTLFLDELPEFRRDALEAVIGAVTIEYVQFSGSAHLLNVPARFRLICAMKPCPCGLKHHPTRKCKCSDDQVLRYNTSVPTWFRDNCRKINFPKED